MTTGGPWPLVPAWNSSLQHCPATSPVWILRPTTQIRPPGHLHSQKTIRHDHHHCQVSLTSPALHLAMASWHRLAPAVHQMQTPALTPLQTGHCLPRQATLRPQTLLFPTNSKQMDREPPAPWLRGRRLPWPEGPILVTVSVQAVMCLHCHLHCLSHRHCHPSHLQHQLLGQVAPL